MAIFLHLMLVFILLSISIATNVAFAGSPSDEFRGDFYNPAKYDGCYEDGIVYHIGKNSIILYGNGLQKNYLEDVVIKKLSDRFVVEAVPSEKATIKNLAKKVAITYKSTDTGFMPVAMIIDNNILDVEEADSRTILENGYSLQRCDSPSFFGWLSTIVAWHTAFKPN